MNSLKVILDTRERHFTQNPYIWMLHRASDPKVEIRGFSWVRAIFTPYDVLHIHWPEYLLRHPSRIRRSVAATLFVALMFRMSIFRTSVVSTRHNSQPHVTGSRLEGILLAQFERLISTRIWLNESDVSAALTSTAVKDAIIPHPMYDEWISALNLAQELDREVSKSNLLLLFGVMRPYKGIDSCLEDFVSEDEAGVSMLIAGPSPDPSFMNRISGACEGTRNAEFRPGRIDDEELVKLITEAAAVVVPHTDLRNSGVLFMGLSLNRPVIVRAGARAAELAQEFGREWVVEVQDFRPATLKAAIDLPRSTSLTTPASRSFRNFAERHRQIYQEASGRL